MMNFSDIQKLKAKPQNISMTFDNYDKMLETFDKMNFHARAWWPNVEDLEKYVLPNPGPYLTFLVWVYETALDPMVEEDEYAKKMVNGILREHLILT